MTYFIQIPFCACIRLVSPQATQLFIFVCLFTSQLVEMHLLHWPDLVNSTDLFWGEKGKERNEEEKKAQHLTGFEPMTSWVSAPEAYTQPLRCNCDDLLFFLNRSLISKSPDGAAWMFFQASMPRPGFKSTSVELHCYQRPLKDALPLCYSCDD